MLYNILCTSNSKFLPHIKVMLHSLFSNHPEDEFDCYFPYEDLTYDEVSGLSEFVASYTGKRLYPIKIGADFKNKVTSNSDISIDTYYRILAIDLLPPNIDRILYLDADLVIKGSIFELYNSDMGECAFTVCKDIFAVLNNFYGENMRRLGIPSQYSYFNAGVMLYNLRYLRQTKAVSKILKKVYENYERYTFNDQDVLNELFYNKVIFVPWNKYNCPPAIYLRDVKSDRYLSYGEIRKLNSLDGTDNDSESVRDHAIIVHYMGRTKPWSIGREDSFVYQIFDKPYFDARRDGHLEPDLAYSLNQFASGYYTLCYIKYMLKKLSSSEVKGLIIGSSYGIHSVNMRVLTNYSNLSVTSQDLKYDYIMFREALARTNTNQIKNLILILGEYALYDCMEKSSSGQVQIEQVYDPLFSGGVMYGIRRKQQDYVILTKK